jgi:metal-dependent amidase/aminoacylase/carboxypeptidase family protein
LDNIDVALTAHASDMRRTHRLFLGNAKFGLTDHGKAGHAAAYRERSINALDNVVVLFVGGGLLRQHISKAVRLHGGRTQRKATVRRGDVGGGALPESVDVHLGSCRST